MCGITDSLCALARCMLYIQMREQRRGLPQCTRWIVQVLGAMGTVHELIETKGRQGAIQAGIDRAVVEAAAAYLSDEDSGLGFAYSGWAQCALPHKRLADDAPYLTFFGDARG